MTTKAVGNKRLEKLATYLEETKFKKGKFHLGTWMAGYHGMQVSVDDEASRELFYIKGQGVVGPTFQLLDGDGLVPVDCKTAGCAVGWGIAGIKSFRKAGLQFSYRDVSETDVNTRVGIQYTDREGRRYSDTSACVQFFALPNVPDVMHGDIMVASMLFVQEYYTLKGRTDPKAVAKRIRTYLAGGVDGLTAAVKRSMPNSLRVHAAYTLQPRNTRS